MFILISILITLAVVIAGIEAANCVAYGFFVYTKWQRVVTSFLISTGRLSSTDFEVMVTNGGHVGVVPYSFLSEYYIQQDAQDDVAGTRLRIIRFTALHREIEAKFQALQQA